jgi:uncharacterized repeat protein (TIGR01451 family)
MRRKLFALAVVALTGSVTGSTTAREAAPAQAIAPAAATCATAALGAARVHPVAPLSPIFSAVADVNGDGHKDLVIVNSAFSVIWSVSVLLGDGLGGFGTAATIRIGGGALASTAGDVNADGHVDLVVATSDRDLISASLAVLLGDGAGSFGAPSSVPMGSGIQATSLALGDVDRDGDLDAVLSSVDGAGQRGMLHVMEGDGSGAFGPPVDLAVGDNPGDLALADFNQDGRLDVALAIRRDPTGTTGGIEIRLGDGAGGFGAPVSFVPAPGVARVAAAAFDEDGDLDLGITTGFPNPSGVRVVLGDGAGHFGAPVVRPMFDNVFELKAADMTGDGHLDLVVSGRVNANDYATIGILAGDGAGDFGAVIPFFPGGTFLAVADLDADGRLDVAAAGTGPRGGVIATVLLSMCGNVADLAISVADSPDPVVLGQQATYTLQVASNGPDVADAAAQLQLPAGLAFVSASASAGACSSALPVDRTVRCLLGDLTGTPPGNTATVTIVARAYEGGLKTVTGTAVTSVLDPTPANNVEAVTTRVTVPGGADLTISSAPGGGVALSWTGGDAQAGYVIGRIVGGVQTQFPPTGMLPPDTTSYVDSTAVAGQINCYQVAPMSAEGAGLALSKMLCAAPGIASPPGALGDYRLARPDITELTWSPFGGQTGYVLRRWQDGIGGSVDIPLPPEVTSYRDGVGNATCFVLFPVNGSTVLANSNALCAVPGKGTLAEAAGLPRLPSGPLR